MRHEVNPPTAGESDMPVGAEALPDERSREVLEKLARWTPPTLMTMLLSTRASAASVLPTDGGFGDPPPLG